MTDGGDREETSIGETINDHAGLLIAALSALAILGRVLAVADWNVPTARAILASSDGPGLLLATAISVIPLVSPLVALAAWDVFHSRPRGTPLRDFWAFAAAIPVMITVFLSPFVVTAAVWGVAAIGGIWRWNARRRGRSGEDPGRQLPPWVYVLVIGGIPLAIYVFTLPQPWLTSERIHLADNRELMGYFLGSSGGWTSILQDEPRIVLNLRDAEVSTRVYCEVPATISTASLATIGPPRLPPCK